MNAAAYLIILSENAQRCVDECNTAPSKFIVSEDVIEELLTLNQFVVKLKSGLSIANTPIFVVPNKPTFIAAVK